MASLTVPILARWLALAWLGLVLLLAVLAPALPLPYPPNVPDLAHLGQAPFGPGRHWLGTDVQGRDVLSMLVFGARTAVLLTVPAALLSAAFGALAGGAAGFWGNRLQVSITYWLLVAGLGGWALGLPWPVLGLALAGLALGTHAVAAFRQRPLPTWPLPIDSAVVGAATTLDTVPRLVLVVTIAAGTGLSVGSLLALLAFTAWPHPARLVRAEMLRVRELPFIAAAEAAGLPFWRIWLRHAIPHAIKPLLIEIPLSLASLLGLESTLSFLGIGLAPDIASWGRLLATVRSDPSAWWAFLFPSICLISSILSFITLSNGKSHKA